MDERKASAIVITAACTVLISALMAQSEWVIFSEDDAHIIQLVLDQNWLSPYLESDEYQKLSVVHYTPILLTAYKALITAAGISSEAYLLAQALILAAIMVLVTRLSAHYSGHALATVLVCLLFLSDMNLISVAYRFYTLHYLLGALASLTCFILLCSPYQNAGFWKAVLLFIATLFALLCKEIYFMLPPLLLFICIRDKRMSAALAVLLASITYLILRIQVLGISDEGRTGNSMLTDLLSLSGQQWQTFAIWYLQHNAIIALTALLAFFYASFRQKLLFIAAGLFLAPALGAPHAISAPEQHADRVLLAFHLGLIVVSSTVLTPLLTSRLKLFLSSTALILIIVPGQAFSIQNFRLQQESLPAYPINAFIQNYSGSSPVTLLTSLNYQEGQWMTVFRLMGKPWLQVTQNCLAAFAQYNEGRTLMIFDSEGAEVTDHSQYTCQRSELRPDIVHDPGYRDGVLSWEIMPHSPGAITGVMFIRRGLSVPVPVFREKLIRPAPDEPYQIFSMKDGRWWFSPIRTLQF
ncbi:hypothetical protein [Oceanospirillum sediminis]|uniref:Glycosyltransferase RgtA/B/C/D-like domain-containing protein n=1 Tax=Oceanospirillum sediminis TaxID=2760088 RepID=A0A839IQ31_9GAMM|nr:hypothetical protein [Oceanospirillum sediminis]MBB1486632.1 hypothetical protein [Oceanospirillum sediminis]